MLPIKIFCIAVGGTPLRNAEETGILPFSLSFFASLKRLEL
jgi:hypothetical protein